MRLNKEKIDFLKTFIKALLSDADIYIFGSRTDNNKKGGDIDILVIGSNKLSFIQKLQLKVKFWKKFGEQKIDIVSYTNNDNNNFKKLILKSAVKI